MKFPEIAEHKCFSYPVHLTKENTFAGSVLINEADVLRCEIRKIGDNPDLQAFESLQNYAGRIPGASDLALEAEIYLRSESHPDWKKLRIGIPLSMAPGVTDFMVKYTGAYFSLYAGDTLLDEEFPFGDPAGTPSHPCEPELKQPSVPCLKKMALHTWTPEGLNVWAGDVSLGVFGKEFHLFYLFDRRHHGSKFCCGAHQWGHLVTEDFRTWRDDGVILPFSDQWQSYGTGTPFLLDGKITLAYGLHTERTFGPGMSPRGAAFAPGDDGLHFIPADRSYDEWPENPSVYNMSDGSFLMYGASNTGFLKLMRAEKWPDFKIISERVAPSGKDSPMHNVLDCPAMFEWHNKYYLLIGFSAMFRGSDPAFTDREDLAFQGMDIYDGLCVPMVAPMGDRRILAGWLNVKGWGGVLGIRELVWFDDGIPGIKWLDEAMPCFTEYQEQDRESVFDEEGYFEFNQPAGGDLLVQFGGNMPLELRLNASLKRAEIALADQKIVPTLFENRDKKGIQTDIQAVDHIRNIDKPYKVRVMIRDERKWDGCIVDVELAGCRTILHHFEKCHLNRCRIVKGNTSFKQGRIEK